MRGKGSFLHWMSLLSEMVAATCATKENISHKARMAKSKDRKHQGPWKCHQTSYLINPGNATLLM